MHSSEPSRSIAQPRKVWLYPKDACARRADIWPRKAMRKSMAGGKKGILLDKTIWMQLTLGTASRIEFG